MSPDTPVEIARALPDPDHAALLLDFDGTLVDLADTPDGIVIPDDLPRLLDRATARLSGRVALVSGRAAGDLARHLPGYDGLIVGSHGAEVRPVGATEPQLAVDLDPAPMKSAVRDHLDGIDGTLVEEKPAGIAVHFRAVPEAQARVEDAVEDALQGRDGWTLQPGKMVLEVKPEGQSKAAALAQHRDRYAPGGETLVYAGDDATDEPAMRYVQDAGGMGLKVGDGDTVGRWRVADPATLRGLLAGWLA